MKRWVGIVALVAVSLIAFLQFDRGPKGVPVPRDETRPPTPLEILTSAPGASVPDAGEASSTRELVQRTPRRESRGDIIARVLAHDGTPAAGVPVRLELNRGKRFPSKLEELPTDSAGWVLFPDPLTAREKAPNGRLGVRWELPFIECDAVALSGDPPWDPVTLRLPPTGQVEVRVLEGDGAPAPRGTRVVLAMVGLEEDIAPLTARDRSHARGAIGSSGTARFSRIPLGRDFAAEVAVAFASSEVRSPGPRTEAELVEISVRIGADHPVVALRAVDEERRLLGDLTVSVQLYWLEAGKSKVDGGYFWNELRTRDDGTFRVGLANQTTWEHRALVVTERIGETQRLYGVLDLPTRLPVGTNRRGDVVLRRPRTLASGRVIGPDHEPRSGVTVALAEPTGWFEWPTSCSPTGPNGEFELLGWQGEPRFEIQAVLERLVSRRVSVALGQPDVELVLPHANRVAGSLVLDEGVSLKGLRISLASGPEEIMSAVNYSDGSFELSPCRPGPATLRVVAGKATLWEVPDVLVPERGDLRDPRLNPIDLRGRMQLHELRISVPDRAQAPKATVLYRVADASNSVPWARVITSGSPVILASPHDALDVLIQTGSYRAAFVRDVRGTEEVVLGEPLEVRLLARSELPLPGWPGPLRAELWRGSYRSARCAEDQWFTDADPAILLRPKTAGRHRVRWWRYFQAPGHSGYRPIDLGPPQFVDVRDEDDLQTFELAIPTDALRVLLDDPN